MKNVTVKTTRRLKNRVKTEPSDTNENVQNINWLFHNPPKTEYSPNKYPALFL